MTTCFYAGSKRLIFTDQSEFGYSEFMPKQTAFSCTGGYSKDGHMTVGVHISLFVADLVNSSSRFYILLGIAFKSKSCSDASTQFTCRLMRHEPVMP